MSTPFAALDALADAPSEDERRDRRRQMGTLLLAAAVLTSPNASDAFVLGTPADWAVELRPARYAFAIWPLLYSGIALFAVFQAQPSQRGSPLLRAVGWPAAAALAIMALWAAAGCAETLQRGMPPSYVAKVCRAVVSAATATGLVGTLMCLLRVTVRLGDALSPFTGKEQLCVVVPLSLLAGWLVPLATGNTLTAATATLALAGIAPPPARGVAAGFAVAVTGAGATFASLRARGNPWFASAAAWGLAAVAYNNSHRGVRADELRNPGAPERPDRAVVFSAGVAAGVLMGASVVRAAFAPRRKWGPRRGLVACCDSCFRNIRRSLEDA